ncbi:MAG: protein phosphatase 2C domain-containing protein [Nannocystaceae bacterium]
MRLIAWPTTDVGRIRSHNEDAYLVDPRLGLYLVADGMGGHAGGAYASRACVEAFREVVSRGLGSLLSEPSDPTQHMNELLAAAAGEASACIFDEAERDPALHGMGTTLTGVLFHGAHAYITHVGDSRCYLIRNGTVRQLTTDHSWLNEQIEAGLLTEEQAAESELRHIITRSIGFEREVEPDILTVHVSPGDAFLLCSDGMSNYIECEELAGLACQHYYGDLSKACANLALSRGGEDNVTVLTVLACNDVDERRPAGASQPMPAAGTAATTPR